jgi:hypothetical protein
MMHAGVYSEIERICSRSLLGVAICGTFLATPVQAHHSFAMYDQKVTRNFTGRLLQIIPGANHAQIIFEVIGPDGEAVLDDKGEAVRWGVETGPAAQIARRGVTAESFPVGTIINLTLNPLRPQLRRSREDRRAPRQLRPDGPRGRLQRRRRDCVPRRRPGSAALARNALAYCPTGRKL